MAISMYHLALVKLSSMLSKIKDQWYQNETHSLRKWGTAARLYQSASSAGLTSEGRAKKPSGPNPFTKVFFTLSA